MKEESVKQLENLQEYIKTHPSIVEIIKISDHINPKYRKSMEAIFVATMHKMVHRYVTFPPQLRCRR